jgi:hypothetical protein
MELNAPGQKPIYSLRIEGFCEGEQAIMWAAYRHADFARAVPCLLCPVSGGSKWNGTVNERCAEALHKFLHFLLIDSHARLLFCSVYALLAFLKTRKVLSDSSVPAHFLKRRR